VRPATGVVTAARCGPRGLGHARGPGLGSCGGRSGRYGGWEPAPRRFSLGEVRCRVSAAARAVDRDQIALTPGEGRRQPAARAGVPGDALAGAHGCSSWPQVLPARPEWGSRTFVLKPCRLPRSGTRYPPRPGGNRPPEGHAPWIAPGHQLHEIGSRIGQTVHPTAVRRTSRCRRPPDPSEPGREEVDAVVLDGVRVAEDDADPRCLPAPSGCSWASSNPSTAWPTLSWRGPSWPSLGGLRVVPGPALDVRLSRRG
jgi:hypothetical protein